MEPRVGAHRVAVIGGDGIGPEVVAEALKVVEAAGVEIETIDYDLGAGRYVRTGEVLPDSVLDELREADAILLGAVGPPIGSTAVPPGVIERGLLLKLRFELDLYINLRPFNGVPGAIAPHADLVLVRENTEGPYVGEGGALRRGTAFEVATQGSVNTRHGVERCVRYAFGLAERRTAHHVTLVHKTNVLTYAGDLWQRTFEMVALEHPGVSTGYNHVDAACIVLVENPGRYDVVVTDNLFGDILADLAGAVAGGIGLAASANLNPARTGPSVFEPVHGAAYDIVGTGKANPLAAIRSAAMMLEHLGEVSASERVTKAVLELQTEMAGSSEPWSTSGVGDAVIRRL
ncbi:MAG: 3-isopropylmalate dehydrogenase [Acidimicrobiales bacterium]|jgi:3-isopropylmalate dehydrogenase